MMPRVNYFSPILMSSPEAENLKKVLWKMLTNAWYFSENDVKLNLKM